MLRNMKQKLFLEAALQGDLNLLKEMKKMKNGRGSMDELPECVDGAEGEQEIADKFKDVYEKLYNSANSDVEMEALKEKIQGLISIEDSEQEIMKVTGEIVKEAITKMKSHKMDVSQGYTSDCLLHAPDILFNQLAMVFQDWMRHGVITQSILACAFIPLLKNSLKNPGNTDSYRAIAGSSLILKCFETCILIIWGDKLNSDSLQFGFKKKCSTSSATWLVQEVLQHFLKRGSNPIAVVLDCSKAFDLAKFNIIFNSLLERGLPAVVVRVLCYSYQEQVAWTRWGRKTTSSNFKISNGTRQGAVASPCFWNIYIDPLFSRLRKGGCGCTIAGVWCGVVGYADDLILLAPCRQAAQNMLQICEEFAKEYNISFSTDNDPAKSKSKAIYMIGQGRRNLAKPVNLNLCGKELPWVDRAEHLGHALHSDGTMRQDIKEKRAQFIDTAVKIKESFSTAYPPQQIYAIEKYCCSWYGSSLWDLNSKEVEMVCASWRTCCKLTWDVPRATRSYLVQETLIPEVTPLRVRLLMNFRGFFKSLLNSPSPEVQVVAMLAGLDITSTAGSNMELLRSETGMNPWTAPYYKLKEALVNKATVKIPPRDFWRPTYLAKLLEQRLALYHIGEDKAVEGVQALIDSLCTS